MNGLPHQLGSLARKCTIALYIYAAFEAAFAVVSFFNILWYNSLIADGQRFLPLTDDFSTQELITLMVALPYLISFIACILICGRWLQRSSANAAVIRPDPNRITPGWSVGWFFIPIANLWKPYHAVRQTWNSSMTDGASLDAPMPKYAFYWWVCWVLTNLIANGSMQSNSDSIDALIFVEIANIASAPFGIIAAILFARLITEITEKQEMHGGAVAKVFE